MKLHSPIALLVAIGVVHAAPRQRFFGDSGPQQEILQDLSIKDFETIQDSLKEAFEHVTTDSTPPAASIERESFSIPNPFPHPPPTLDYSHLTILEIVNASLGHHHEHPHERIVPAVIDEKDPSHLPLHRLAWLVNFSSETQEYLKGDDITLLAPDDAALTPPHHSGGGEHGHERPHFGRRPEGLDLDKSHMAHPFHSREFSPKKLGELAATSDNDDEDKERKREIFRKIISYVGKYHVVPGRREAKDLGEVSTVATLLEDSRLRVSPGFDWKPFPHPTLKFNYYVTKRGPTILAKNGIIHLVSAPLAPPFGPLNELFLFPKYFSSLTSDVQKVGLDEDLLPSHDSEFEDYEEDEEDEEDEEEESSISEQLVEELIEEKGLKEYTVFAPTNWAYAQVPTGLNVALHFPFSFSEKVLKYMIAGHVVPDIVFFSDFLKNDTTASVSKFEVSREENVAVPLEWLEKEDHHRLSLRDIKVEEIPLPRMPTFPRPRGRGGAPPPPPPPPPGMPSPPHKGPRGRPPPPPHEDHPREHPHANVTHYELPTLLTAENPKAVLKVAVVAYRLGPGDKGPIKRSVVVFPHRPHHHKHHDDHEGGVEAKMCPRQDPFSPIRAVFADFPAKAGAIHVLPRLIPPPPPRHHPDDKEEEDFDYSNSFVGLSSKHEVKKLRKALARIF